MMDYFFNCKSVCSQVFALPLVTFQNHPPERGDGWTCYHIYYYSFVFSFTSIPWNPWEESWTCCKADCPSAPRLSSACLATSCTSLLGSCCWRQDSTSTGLGHSGAFFSVAEECFFFLLETLFDESLCPSILLVLLGRMGARTPSSTHAASRSLVLVDSSSSKHSSTI